MGFELKVDDDLSLRLIEPHHAGELYAVVDANREHLGRWMAWMCPEACLEDTRRFAERSLLGFAQRKELVASILLDGRVIGVSGWHEWNQSTLFHGHLDYSNAELGYWIDGRYQGRGIMTRAVRALTTLAFEIYGIRRLTIHAETENQRSWKVAERLGYRYEGTLRDVARHDGRTVDHRVYAMLAGEWTP